MGDHRPAVVLAGFGNVDFIAAARAVLMQPQRAGLRMQGRALRIAVAVTPDFRERTGAIDKRIVRRHAAVASNPNHLAQMCA